MLHLSIYYPNFSNTSLKNLSKARSYSMILSRVELSLSFKPPIGI
jgi:hypothetical protein